MESKKRHLSQVMHEFRLKQIRETQQMSDSFTQKSKLYAQRVSGKDDHSRLKVVPVVDEPAGSDGPLSFLSIAQCAPNVVTLAPIRPAKPDRAVGNIHRIVPLSEEHERDLEIQAEALDPANVTPVTHHKTVGNSSTLMRLGLMVTVIVGCGLALGLTLKYELLDKVDNNAHASSSSAVFPALHSPPLPPCPPPCPPPPPTPSPPPYPPWSGTNLFDDSSVLHVELDLIPSDWQSLREDTPARDFDPDYYQSHPEACLAAREPPPYYPANARIRNIAINSIGVRRQGAGEGGPSLRLQFDHFLPQVFDDGMGETWERVRLERDSADPARVRQCLAFGLFRKAGLPAPRCNLATVHVNGEYLGIYTNVEEVRSRFLETHYGSKHGTLYEGALSDFTEWGQCSFVPTVEGGNSTGGAGIQAVTAALGARHRTDVVQMLAPLLDLERFMRFWAMEVLTHHWDGFTGNRNSCFVFADPTTGKLSFIPSGTHSTFDERELPQWSKGCPGSHFLGSVLTRALYADDTARAQYFDALKEVLAQVWDEEAIVGQIERQVAMLAPFDPSGKLPKRARALKQWVLARRAALDQALAAAPTVQSLATCWATADGSAGQADSAGVVGPAGPGPAPPSGASGAAQGASVLLCEVADQGSEGGVCGGRGWVELFNAAEVEIDLTGWMLSDETGPTGVGALRIGGSEGCQCEGPHSLAPKQSMVLCRSPAPDCAQNNSTGCGFGFEIDAQDMIILWTPEGAVADFIALPGRGPGEEGTTYARHPDWKFKYSAPATPGTCALS